MRGDIYNVSCTRRASNLTVTSTSEVQSSAATPIAIFCQGFTKSVLNVRLGLPSSATMAASSSSNAPVVKENSTISQDVESAMHGSIAPATPRNPKGSVPEAVSPSLPSPEHKRLKLNDPEWTEDTFHKIYKRGLTITVNENVEADELDVLTKEVKRVTDKLQDTLDHWDTITPTYHYKNALLVLAMYIDLDIHWDPKSDMLLARVVAALNGGRLRAHSDAARYYCNGAWRVIDALPAKIVIDVEKAFSFARYLCQYLAESGIERDWDAVFTAFEFFEGWEDYKVVEDFDFKDKHWAKTASQVFVQIPWRVASSSQKIGLHCFLAWFQEDYPELSPFLNTNDACLKVQYARGAGPLVQQVPKSPDNNCYVHLNIELKWEPPEDKVDWLNEIMDQSFAGNCEARLMNDCHELTGILGCNYTRFVLFLTGFGSNSKSLLAALRANIAGDSHKFVSPTVFETPEEFRKQGGQFAHARLLTIDECSGGTLLLEAVFKPFASGEHLACRPNYGKQTEYLSWRGAAIAWNCNRELPRIRVTAITKEYLMAWTERITVLQTTSSFVSDPDNVDPLNHIYLANPKAKEFVSSGLAKYIRLNKQLMPMTELYSLEEMVEKLNNPSQRIRQGSYEFVEKMARGGLTEATSDGQEERDALRKAKDMLSTVFKSDLVKKQKHHFVKKYVLRTHPSIPGLQKERGSEKKPSKIDNFNEAVGLYPYLFKEVRERDGYTKANINLELWETLIAKYDAGVIGALEDFPPVFECRDFHGSVEEADEVPEATEVTQSITINKDIDVSCDVLVEVVNLYALKEYATKAVDRRQDCLLLYIQRIESEGYSDETFPGMMCLQVEYVQKFGIARKYAIGWSLQHMTKEARAAACGTSEKCWALDADFEFSVANMALRLAKKHGVEDKVAVLARCVANAKAWKEFEKEYDGLEDEAAAKFELLRVFFFAKVKTDNPLLYLISKFVLFEQLRKDSACTAVAAMVLSRSGFNAWQGCYWAWRKTFDIWLDFYCLFLNMRAISISLPTAIILQLRGLRTSCSMRKTRCFLGLSDPWENWQTCTRLPCCLTVPSSPSQTLQTLTMTAMDSHLMRQNSLTGWKRLCSAFERLWASTSPSSHGAQHHSE